MSSTSHVTPDQLPSDEERQMLRDSVRGFLLSHWSPETAVARNGDAGAQVSIWRGLADQGVTALGSEPMEGGLREMLVVQQELGRAACAAPMRDAFLLNTLLGVLKDDPVVNQLLANVANGSALVCLSFGRLDHDRHTGRLSVDGGLCTGTARFIEGASAATHFAVFADGGELCLVKADDPGVNTVLTPALGVPWLHAVTFSKAVAHVVPVASARVQELLSVSRLAYAARAWGAADRAFEMVVAYVKERRQFGQAVGRFQAIQHKLANCLMSLWGIQLSLDNAAEHFDRHIPEWTAFAAAAWAFASETLRQISMETHHAFGAIGYAEEHEAPRHFRRVHLDMTRHGGGAPAREELARRYLDEDNEMPEFDLGEAGNAFRREVREWLGQHWPKERRHAYEARDTTHREYDEELARQLGAKGWLGLTWPQKFGGMERSAFELLAFMQELERAEAPRAGSPIQAAAWMQYGTPEQQERYLPELLRGEASYGMWYSEPDSGSDLSSIRTKAVRDGDEWVINGQKIWTTTYWADYMWLVAKTDPDAKPAHAGISMFVLPSNTPGVTRNPMRTMYDGEFCNTFLDNVRVPASAMIGEVNGGWKVLTGNLGTERAYVGSRIAMKMARQFEQFCGVLRSESEADGPVVRQDPLVRSAIGGFAAQIEAARQLALHSIKLYARGEEPTWEAAMAKVYAGELMERFNESALDILGMQGTLSADAPEALVRGRIEQNLRHSLMWVISIGTNEIQRNLIALRGLGLPR
ncbi:acyl-CoA dehydrogenase [Hydrogenophaga laconesensis]|uniref:Alkylation response protein AidB-like acyl-CoA dehydrogenase n=1 Tax=Hydrogenophaga laconesensis TaxID=1805971 RepID=A0ABU1VJA1_9BURK|nr:acyl-CoA dehydrogenase [Hydrogenophaga laconesensis]MDR7097570.1 alkylation response protein AidB-like acyl-CoA dehydrogenase [Hydrogenophaga laconesensis]